MAAVCRRPAFDHNQTISSLTPLPPTLPTLPCHPADFLEDKFAEGDAAEEHRRLGKVADSPQP